MNFRIVNSDKVDSRCDTGDRMGLIYEVVLAKSWSKICCQGESVCAFVRWIGYLTEYWRRRMSTSSARVYVFRYVYRLLLNFYQFDLSDATV